jgi:hypothetical protein
VPDSKQQTGSETTSPRPLALAGGRKTVAQIVEPLTRHNATSSAVSRVNNPLGGDTDKPANTTGATDPLAALETQPTATNGGHGPSIIQIDHR